MIASFQPYFCNGVSKLATVWFGDEQRALATTIGSLATPIGCILGMIMGPFFVSENDRMDYDLGRKHVIDYMFFTAGFVTVLTVPMLLLYTERPEHFPSSAAKNMINTKFDFKDEIVQLKNNRNYRWISIAFMFMYGVYTCLGAVINGLVSKFGFTSSDSSIMGACFIMSGLIGSFFFGGQLDKNK
jgi:sugar phosphate permease